MTRPSLLVTRRLPDVTEALAQTRFVARLFTSDTPRPWPELLAGAEGTAALLCSPGDQLDAVINSLPETVRVIGTFSVGHDHIDLAAARTRRMAVVNTPDVLSVATAECALLLLLMAARRAGEGERLVRSGQWTGWAPTQLIGKA